MTANSEFKDFHWLMGMLDGIDVGLVVIDRNFTIQVWNRFMSSHSGMEPSQAQSNSIFEVFPELPKDWFTHKVESVFLLNNRSFTIHEQRRNHPPGFKALVGSKKAPEINCYVQGPIEGIQDLN